MSPTWSATPLPSVAARCWSSGSRPERSSTVAKAVTLKDVGDILRAAGLGEASVAEGTLHVRTGGFRGFQGRETVRLTFWPADGYSSCADETVMEQQEQEMLSRYVTVLRTAGLAADLQSGVVVVTGWR